MYFESFISIVVLLAADEKLRVTHRLKLRYKGCGEVQTPIKFGIYHNDHHLLFSFLVRTICRRFQVIINGNFLPFDSYTLQLITLPLIVAE